MNTPAPNNRSLIILIPHHALPFRFAFNYETHTANLKRGYLNAARPGCQNCTKLYNRLRRTYVLPVNQF